jgi:hypothetical protein
MHFSGCARTAPCVFDFEWTRASAVRHDHTKVLDWLQREEEGNRLTKRRRMRKPDKRNDMCMRIDTTRVVVSFCRKVASARDILFRGKSSPPRQSSPAALLLLISFSAYVSRSTRPVLGRFAGLSLHSSVSVNALIASRADASESPSSTHTTV